MAQQGGQGDIMWEGFFKLIVQIGAGLIMSDVIRWAARIAAAAVGR